MKAIVNGVGVNIKIEHIKGGYSLTCRGAIAKTFVRSTRVAELEALLPVKKANNFKRQLNAPLTGLIVDIKGQEGDIISPGQGLVILTAMKMENIISAPHAAKIVKIHVTKDQNVNSGQLLMEFAKV